MSSRKIAIIPARGGSKRIPRKNIKDFLGKPIIAYSIKAAIDSKLFDEVMVSTEDEEIAILAQKYGAKVPFLRSSKNANDFSTTFDVIQEVIDTYRQKNITWDYGCCIYPTAPFTSEEILKEGFEKLKQEDFITLFPIVAFDYPIWRGFVKNNEKVNMRWPEYQSSRSQDLETIYHDAGQWYWFQTKKLEVARQLFTPNSGFIELNRNRVHDIDSMEDWELAEMKYKALNS